MKLFLIVVSAIVACFLFGSSYECVKIKKNRALRNIIQYLTERVESDSGENEFARLTQAPIVKMDLSKTVYKTSLQNILVRSYSEKVKDVIAKAHFDINTEKSILEELNDSLLKMNTLNMLLLENENSELLGSNLRNKYSHYLDNTTNEDLFYYPVYKTLKANSANFINALDASLTPSELLEKGEISHEQFLKNSQNKLVFPERGDKITSI